VRHGLKGKRRTKEHCFAVRQKDGDLAKEGVTFSADGHLADEFLLWAGRGWIDPTGYCSVWCGSTAVGYPQLHHGPIYVVRIMTHKIMNNPL